MAILPWISLPLGPLTASLQLGDHNLIWLARQRSRTASAAEAALARYVAADLVGPIWVSHSRAARWHLSDVCPGASDRRCARAVQRLACKLYLAVTAATGSARPSRCDGPPRPEANSMPILNPVARCHVNKFSALVPTRHIRFEPERIKRLRKTHDISELKSCD